jgi:hypothetical protein
LDSAVDTSPSARTTHVLVHSRQPAAIKAAVEAVEAAPAAEVLRGEWVLQCHAQQAQVYPDPYRV